MASSSIVKSSAGKPSKSSKSSKSRSGIDKSKKSRKDPSSRSAGEKRSKKSASRDSSEKKKKRRKKKHASSDSGSNSESEEPVAEEEQDPEEDDAEEDDAEDGELDADADADGEGEGADEEEEEDDDDEDEDPNATNEERAKALKRRKANFNKVRSCRNFKKNAEAVSGTAGSGVVLRNAISAPEAMRLMKFVPAAEHRVAYEDVDELERRIKLREEPYSTPAKQLIQSHVEQFARDLAYKVVLQATNAGTMRPTPAHVAEVVKDASVAFDATTTAPLGLIRHAQATTQKRMIGATRDTERTYEAFPVIEADKEGEDMAEQHATLFPRQKRLLEEHAKRQEEKKAARLAKRGAAAA